MLGLRKQCSTVVGMLSILELTVKGNWKIPEATWKWALLNFTCHTLPPTNTEEGSPKDFTFKDSTKISSKRWKIYLYLPSWELHQIGKINCQRGDQGVPPCLGGLSPGLLRAVLRDRQGDYLCLLGGIMVTVTFCPLPLEFPVTWGCQLSQRILSYANDSF